MSVALLVLGCLLACTACVLWQAMNAPELPCEDLHLEDAVEAEHRQLLDAYHS